MSEKIIDEVNYLMTLTDDELNELLISEKYNKANLRELVRRTLKTANEYKKAFEYEISEEKKETDESLMNKRLDAIENWYEVDASVSPGDFEWLIEQVRRMQEEKERYKKALNRIAEDISVDTSEKAEVIAMEALEAEE